MTTQDRSEQVGALIMLETILSYLGRQGPVLSRDKLVHAVDHFRTTLIDPVVREEWDMRQYAMYEESED